MSGMETLDEIMKDLEAKNQQKNKPKQVQEQSQVQQYQPQQFQPMPYQPYPPQQQAYTPFPQQSYPQQPYNPYGAPMQQPAYPMQGQYPMPGQYQPQQQSYQPQMQQQQPTPQQHFISPEQSAQIDISQVILDKDKLYQIYVGNVPQIATAQLLKQLFESCGEIIDTHIQPQQGKTGFGFVNFKTRDGALAAFKKRNFFMGGEKLDLAGFHKQLTIILRRIPPNVNEEEFQKTILEFYAYKNHQDIYSYVQFANARFGSSVYLHFLSKEESITAFDLLTPMEFTKFATEKMKMIDDVSQAIYISNEEVDRRQKQGQKPNQDLQREILQYLCVRFVPKTEAKVQQPMMSHQQQYQHAMPMQQQNQQYQYMQNNNQNMQNNNMQGQQVLQDSSVYMTALPFGITQDALKAVMQQFGQVNVVTLINSRESMGQNPSAIVYFTNQSSAQQALQKGIVNVGGSEIRINPHKKRVR